MRLSLHKTIAFAAILFLVTNLAIAQETNYEASTLNALSEKFLENVKSGKDTQDIQDQLANTPLKTFENGLRTDAQKLAFWVNIYNAYIQVILSKNPELYNDRRAFFGENRIKIAGELVSFAKIEHGIIRKSQWPLGLGKIRKWFPNAFERKLRVKKRDYRVHFALNCGAKDCPPVAIYKAELLEEQFNQSTTMYLKKTTSYDASKNEAMVTALFSWFRGDFGNKSGVKHILKNEKLIPSTKGVTLIYKNYDWTLDLVSSNPS